MIPDADAIVVGSGASAVHAAWPLVDAGLRVAMLDVGHEDEVYTPRIPDAPFDEIRRRDPEQHVWMLGLDYEGVPLDPLGAGPQVTPPRRHVLQHVDRLNPTDAHGFEPLQSLATGGLAGAWGAVSFPFLDRELERCGLPVGAMRRHYEVIARRIGVSAEPGDLAEIAGRLDTVQPALEIDALAQRVLGRYVRRRDAFRREGMRLGRPFLAALSRRLGDRRAQRYHDLDFWSNAGGSVYRPDLSVAELRRREGFRYLRPWLVEAFRETSDGRVEVDARVPDRSGRSTFAARRLVLAAGTLGTARIVLRSLERYDVHVPLTCNPHTYVPCLVPGQLGRGCDERRHSLAQLTLVHDPTADREHLVQAQLYSYRSLLLYRLLPELPLPRGPALRILRTLQPAFAIWVVQHEDEVDEGKTCVLRRSGERVEDRLEIRYDDPPEAVRKRESRERSMVRAMRRLGCVPLGRKHETHGSSVHYASAFPASRESRPLTTEPSGRLRGTRGVFLADGSPFGYVPAKGLTLTLMANADRVARHVIDSLGEHP